MGFSINSDLIDKYSIIRDNVVIIENAPNNPQSAQIGFDEWNNNQYIRDYSNLENCRTYKYKVRTHLCNNLSIDSEEIPVTVQESINDYTWVSNELKQPNATKGDYENRIEISWNNNTSLIHSLKYKDA